MTARRTPIAALLLLGLLFSVALCLSTGEKMKRDAYTRWVEHAQNEVNSITDVIYSRMIESSVAVRGYSTLFFSGARISEEEFETAFDNAADWNTDPSFELLAYARRALRHERSEIIAEIGAPIIPIENPEEEAPVFYESYIVTHNNNQTHFPIGTDFSSLPQTRTVVETAFRRRHQTVMGPAIDLEDGLHVPFGIYASHAGIDGVLVAVMNLSEFLDLVMSTQAPVGVDLRLSERVQDAMDHSEVISLRGPLTPPVDALETFKIRLSHGQARWDLSWDVYESYQDGPNLAPGATVQWGGSGIVGLLPEFSAQGWMGFAAGVSDWGTAVAAGARAAAATLDPAFLVGAGLVSIFGLVGMAVTVLRWRRISLWRDDR